MVKVGIAGGSGYGGVELIHILVRHPEAELTWISSQQHKGERVDEVYAHLRKFTDLSFSSLTELPASELDVLFLALPHGEAMKIVPDLPRQLVIIDLSGDFRISDPAIFQEYYDFPQSAVAHQADFVYGLTELNRDRIRSSHRVANPGCFATATILALHPLFQNDWVKGAVFVDSNTGSSGAGRSPRATTHHPRRSNSMFGYKPFRHQHLPEIKQALGEPDHRLVFQAHSAPFVRGIFATHYLELTRPVPEEEVAQAYECLYGNDFFIRWMPGCPDVNLVRHSNFVDIGAAIQDNFLVVWSVLDNLQKGAAGQAVQNMNVIFNFPEETALDLAPVHP